MSDSKTDSFFKNRSWLSMHRSYLATSQIYDARGRLIVDSDERCLNVRPRNFRIFLPTRVFIKFNPYNNTVRSREHSNGHWLKFNRVYTVFKLSHWGRETHICIGKLTIIGSDNGLSPGRRQAIIWTNAGILLIGPLGTNFNEILIEIHTFSFTKIHLKMSSAKWRPFCLGLNVLKRFQTFVGCLFSQMYVWVHAIKVNTGH